MSYNYFSCVSKMEKEKIKIKKWGGGWGGGGVFFQEGDRNLGQHFTGKTCDRQALFAYLYSFVCHIAACQ